MHNATELEKLGVPAIAICTEPFAKTADSMARRRGFPNYRFILVEHPLSSARTEGIQRRAAGALAEIAAIALGDEVAREPALAASGSAR
ncbi:MAG: hypothetical protein KGJ86_21360 [Chloroflexota bacterium]|nr:hypothetical protein [Chloroflexota bacterium]